MRNVASLLAEALRPDPRAVHLFFDLMVGIGFFLAALIGWFWIAFWRNRGIPTGRWLLWASVLSGFLGFIAIEAGWMVTEFGRQPWAARGVMLIDSGYSPAPGVPGAFYGFSVLYILLAATLVWLLKRIATGAPPDLEDRETGSEGEAAHAS